MPSLAMSALLLALTVGCDERREAELLEITRVEPAVVEPGQTLVVEGRGFPPGRDVRVRIAGIAHRPGAEPTPVRVEVTGRARSSERIEVRLDAEPLRALGTRATVRGELTAVFASPVDGAVMGRARDFVIDVSPASTQGLSDALSRAREAGAAVHALGLTLDEEGPDAPGLPIVSVAEGSTAERAGLAPSDRVLELAGVRVHALSDVLPPPGASAIELRIARRGEAAPFSVVVPWVSEIQTGVDTVTLRSAEIALAWVLAILFLLAPSAGIVDALAQRGERERRTTHGGRWARWRALLSQVRGELAVHAAALALIAAVPALDHARPVDVPIGAMLLAMLAVRVGSAWLAVGEEGPRARLFAALHAFAGVAAIALAFGVIAALAGSGQLLGIASRQGDLPIDWTLVRTPLSPLAIGLAAYGAVHVPVGLARGRDPAARLARRLDDLVLLGVALSLAIVFLGGFRSEALDPAVRGVRTAAFVGLSWGMFAWLRRTRASAHTTGANVAMACLAAVGLVGAASLIVWSDPPAELLQSLGRVFGVALVALWAIVIARIAAGRPDPRAVPAHPFL